MIIKSFIPAILWGLVIFFIISLPVDAMPDSGLLDIPYFDKVVHTTIFMVFAFLLGVGFYFRNASLKKPNNISIVKVLIIAFVYGGITEISQEMLFSSRNGSFSDFVTNVIGSLLGILICKYFIFAGYIKVFKFLEK